VPVSSKNTFGNCPSFFRQALTVELLPKNTPILGFESYLLPTQKISVESYPLK
jgi:hypothetical protein